MNPRAIFFTSAGAVRAGWRALLFCVVALVFYEIIFSAFLFVGRAENYALLQLEQYLLFLLALWLAHHVMLRFVDHAPWSYVGLGRAQLTPHSIGVGLALGTLCILIPSGGLLLAHDLTVTTGLQGRHGWLVLALGGVAMFLPQSLGEEMMMRGYLFAALRDGIGWMGALAATSITFGLMHMRNPGASAQSVGIVILAGIFLGAILIATRSLYAAWMAHFAWNWTMADILHSPVSGINFPYSTYRLEDAGPAWLTGGSWGPEGGAAAAAGMLAGLAVVVAWRRSLAREGNAA
ncbi:MAG: CPBP family intramembrane metalloprotease [Gemmatimonadaceae bacterium]|nr:CPBP family intramembrane metalloprotease [Gemmatimonadaceae bacterium]